MAPSPLPLIACPPEVLEPSHYIAKVPGCLNHIDGYRICGDNIDKMVRARYMRSDKRNSTLHYFHSFAVKNCIDISELSDKPVDKSSLDPYYMAESVLPSSNDDGDLCSKSRLIRCGCTLPLKVA